MRNGALSLASYFFQENPGLKPGVTEAAESEYQFEAEVNEVDDIETKFACWLRESGLQAKGVWFGCYFNYAGNWGMKVDSAKQSL